MKIWNNYWYGPVAAIRPYLMLKGVLLLLAFDVWNLITGLGAVFYDDRFQMAHFRFLDWLPVPTPSLYVGLVLLCGMLSFLIALVGTNRAGLAILFVLYTCLWSLTRIDLYQHHYLLSLVLACLVFFPRIGWDDWYPVSVDHRKGSKPAKQRAPIATSAGGFVMLGVLIAIVFVYTAIAKLDAMWLEGHTLQTIDKGGSLLRKFGGIFTALGRSPKDIWSFAATSVVFVELTIAVGYLTAVGQDRRSSRWCRFVFLAMWVVATTLHVGFETLSLRIGWFSYYMLVAASIFFLPAAWLSGIGGLILWPGRWLSGWWNRQSFGRNHIRWILIGTAGAVLVILIAIGKWIDLPGALATLVLAGFGLLGYVLFGVFRFRGSTAPIRRAVIAMGLAPLVMWVAIANSAERFRFYVLLGDDIQRRMHNDEGQLNQGETAIDAYGKAEGYAPNGDPRLPAFHNKFGFLYDSQGRYDAAVLQFRKALRFDPDHVVSRINLGQALVSLGQVNEGIDHLRKVIRDKPNSHVALNGLAWILATNAREDVRAPVEAVDLAERAFEVAEDEKAAILDTLATAYAAAGRFEEAVVTEQKAIDLARGIYPDAVMRELAERLDLYRKGIPYKK